jgi:hypothetical protein
VLLDQVHQGGKRPHIKVMPHFDLSDDEVAAALIKELHDTLDNDRYPTVSAHPDAEGHSRQAQARAGPRAAAAAAEAVCATASNRYQEAATRLEIKPHRSPLPTNKSRSC